MLAELLSPEGCEEESVPGLSLPTGGLQAIFGALWLVEASL